MLLTLITLCSFVQTYARNDSLSIAEYKRMMDIVNNKIGHDNYKTEFLKDFKGDDSFILIEGNKSYLIYNRKAQEYMECSTNHKSFYYNIKSQYEKYYYAPTYYFYKDEAGNFYDAISGKKAKKEYIIELVNSTDSREEELEYRIANDRELNNTSGSVLCPFYFENLNYNFPVNENNSCGYVAMVELLSYYDAFYRDDIIADTYDVNTTKEFSYYDSILMSEYTSSPGVSATNEYQNGFLHHFIYDYCYYASNGIYQSYIDNDYFRLYTSDVENMLEYYFSEDGINKNVLINHDYTGSTTAIKTSIDNHNPVIVKISGTNEFCHFVVAYKYDSNGIYAHFGWHDNNYYDANILQYNINNSVSIDLYENHSHSDNYRWTHNNFSGSICFCNFTTCNHYSTYAVQSNDNRYHRMMCTFCNHYSHDELHHFTHPSNYVCDVCGYETSLCNHLYAYYSHTATSHKLICQMCGYIKTETHNFIYIQGRYYCTKCPYSTTTPIINLN